MYPPLKQLDNLVRHIELVHQAGFLLAKRLIELGRERFARTLMGQVMAHDTDKFYGIQWDYLHKGPDVPTAELWLAVHDHNSTNTHHPEYHDGIENMPELDVAEMVCDWYARSQERGTGLRDWIDREAIEKFKLDKAGEQWAWIQLFVNILLEDSFVKTST